MKEEYTIRGWWWLLNQSDKKISGIAEVIQGEGATLTLLEVLPVSWTGLMPDLAPLWWAG